jgi:orotidine-5'-phosphate decarboxylase
MAIDSEAASKLFLAFDYPNIFQPEPINLLHELKGSGIGVKFGLEAAKTTYWPSLIHTGQALEYRVFADTKYYDIGRTVSRTIETDFRARPDFVTVAADMSEAGLKHVVEIRDKIQALPDLSGLGRTAILGVTVLTDKSNRESWRDYHRSRSGQVLHWSEKALDCGLDGIVCAPADLKRLAKKSKLDNLIKVATSIRPSWAPPDEQKNAATPAQAIKDGATYLIIARAVTEYYPLVGNSPLDAVEAISQELSEAA